METTTTTTITTTRRPQYSCETEGRLANALARASQMKHRAHWIGHNPRTGADVYEVWSNTHADVQYFCYASPVPAEGFVYTRGTPHYWITCTCDSWGTYQQPCCHAAKVALRLQREARRATPKMLTRAPQTPPTPAAPATITPTAVPVPAVPVVTLESLFTR